MIRINSINFESPLNVETSYTNTHVVNNQQSEMVFFTHTGSIDDTDSGVIEWVYLMNTDSEDALHIGVWWDENHVLIDYDGVFTLPDQAINLLMTCGISVPVEFKN